VRDHCNGLILIDDTVVNPAMHHSARLPLYPLPCLRPWYNFYTNEYIAFDPLVSPTTRCGRLHGFFTSGN
jgi:hypothetical protein